MVNCCTGLESNSTRCQTANKVITHQDNVPIRVILHPDLHGLQEGDVVVSASFQVPEHFVLANDVVPMDDAVLLTWTNHGLVRAAFSGVSDRASFVGRCLTVDGWIRVKQVTTNCRNVSLKVSVSAMNHI